MTCQKCKANRVVTINAKCDDRCHVSYGRIDASGYVPADMGIGGGDYIKFRLCLECGYTQGTWPHPTASIEQKCQYCSAQQEAVRAWNNRAICYDCWGEIQND